MLSYCRTKVYGFPAQPVGQCEARVYTRQGQSPVVILIDTPGNSNSLTNWFEDIAREVWWEIGKPDSCQWFHYFLWGPFIGQIKQVTFSHHSDQHPLYGPVWIPSDVATVAQMIGNRL